jgi:lipopolysaccharide/colanic/teichoic acid biosynthesis glycosyltransferase
VETSLRSSDRPCLRLLILAPVIVVLAVLVRVKLGTPIFFRQLRPGLHGKPFTMVKFRTMTDARDASGALLPDADRLTAFGKFLRATSLDELPELWNVVKGEMSLVGPRPLLMQYLTATRRNRRAVTQCAPASPAGRRSTGATPFPGSRSLPWMSGMWTTSPSGSISKFCG